MSSFLRPQEAVGPINHGEEIPMRERPIVDWLPRARAEAVTLARLGPPHVIHGPLVHGMAHERRLFWECRSCGAIWEVFSLSDAPTVCPNEDSLADYEASVFRDKQRYWEAISRVERNTKYAVEVLGMPARTVRVESR